MKAYILNQFISIDIQEKLQEKDEKQTKREDLESQNSKVLRNKDIQKDENLLKTMRENRKGNNKKNKSNPSNQEFIIYDRCFAPRNSRI